MLALGILPCNRDKTKTHFLSIQNSSHMDLGTGYLFILVLGFVSFEKPRDNKGVDDDTESCRD